MTKIVYISLTGNTQTFVDRLGYCKGVVGCGNINFAELYCFTAKDLSRDYNIPLLHMMEYFGNGNDLKKIKGVVESLGTA